MFKILEHLHVPYFLFIFYSFLFFGGDGGSVVECLTQDRRAAGSSLTGVTVLCP